MRLRTGCHRSTALHPTGCTWQGLGIPERAVASLRSAAPTTSHSLAPLTATACLPRRPPPASLPIHTPVLAAEVLNPLLNKVVDM